MAGSNARRMTRSCDHAFKLTDRRKPVTNQCSGFSGCEAIADVLSIHRMCSGLAGATVPDTGHFGRLPRVFARLSSAFLGPCKL